MTLKIYETRNCVGPQDLMDDMNFEGTGRHEHVCGENADNKIVCNSMDQFVAQRF